MKIEEVGASPEWPKYVHISMFLDSDGKLLMNCGESEKEARLNLSAGLSFKGIIHAPSEFRVFKITL